MDDLSFRLGDLKRYPALAKKMLYKITATNSPWWECGPEVPHGITGHLGRNEKGILQLERPGPRIPQFTVPCFSRLIVTSEISDELMSEFNAIELRDVDYANVVPLNWHEWEIEAAMPEKELRYHMPDYLMDTDEFDDMLIEEMPKAFELVPEIQIDLNKLDEACSNAPRDIHFFDAVGRGSLNYTIVSETAKNWIEYKQPLWLNFEKIPPDQPENEIRRIVVKSRYGDTPEEIARNMRKMNPDG